MGLVQFVRLDEMVKARRPVRPPWKLKRGGFRMAPESYRQTAGGDSPVLALGAQSNGLWTFQSHAKASLGQRKGVVT